MKKIILVLLIVTSMCLLIIGSNFSDFDRIEKSDKFIKKMEGEIPSLMDKALIPGLSISVIKDGKVFWVGNFGKKNVKIGNPVDSDTIFEAASLSKPVFAYAILQLIDQGKLDLDIPLIDYCGEKNLNSVYSKTKGADERYKKITARMVLTHSTGLPNWVSNKPLHFKFNPGKRFSYSGEAFNFLAVVVEKITGKKLNDYMNEMVFKPLKMNNSSFVWLTVYKKQFAASHNFLGEVTPRGKRKIAVAAASLYTNSEDYSKFLVALINGKDLSSKIYKKIFIPQIDVPARYEKNKKACEWGLGVGLHKTPKSNTFWHWGDNGDFKSYFEMSLDNKNGVVFFCNSDNGHAISEKIVQLTTGIPSSAMSTDYFIYPSFDSFVIKMFRTYKKDGFTGLETLFQSINKNFIKKEKYLKYAFLDLGRYLVRQKNNMDGEKLFKIANKLYPEYATNLIYLSRFLFLRGESDQGLNHLRKALKLDNNIEGGINNCGYALMNHKKYNEAITVFKFNANSFPLSANCFDSLGEAYLTMGDKINAKYYYNKALKINPNMPSAISALKNM